MPASSSPTSPPSAQSATTTSPGGVPSPRPPFQHSNTQVYVTDPSPVAPTQQVPQDYQLPYLETDQDEPDPVISLADIPQLIEGQQYRNSGRKLVAELNTLEFTVLKYTALWKLARSQLRDHIDLDEMLEFLETKKSGFWNKLLRGGEKKEKKKGERGSRGTEQELMCYPGVFCVPLELLVDREGTESVLGATTVPLRIPSFIDDIVSAMKQMGGFNYPIKVYQSLISAFQICQWRVFSERMVTFEG